MPPDIDHRRLRVIEQVLGLPEPRLAAVEQLLSALPVGVQSATAPSSPSWPHAPLHRLGEHGTYLVTTGIYQKEHFFREPARRDFLHDTLLELASQAGWQLEAWAVFSNHYHFVGHTAPDAEPLNRFLAQLHYQTSTYVNGLDRQDGRRVWFNYWETALTFERSYFARLNYVHQNAVRHGLVAVANQYRWCSAGWFERTATRAQVGTIYGFKGERLKVPDDFDPV